MLETVREHALERMRARGQLDSCGGRHAERFLELALAAESELAGRPRQVARSAGARVRQLDAAIDWLLSSGRAEDALRAISRSSASGVAMRMSQRRDGWLALASRAVHRSARRPPRATLSGPLRAWPRGRATGTPPCHCSRRRRLCSGRRTVAESSSSPSPSSGSSNFAANDAERAAALCDEALAIARELGDARATSGVLTILSDVARMQGDHARALASAEEALELRRTLDDPLSVADATYHVGVAAFGAGDLDRSENAFEDALALAREVGDAMYTAAALCMLGTTGLLKDDLALVEERLTREPCDLRRSRR